MKSLKDIDLLGLVGILTLEVEAVPTSKIIRANCQKH